MKERQKRERERDRSESKNVLLITIYHVVPYVVPYDYKPSEGYRRKRERKAGKFVCHLRHLSSSVLHVLSSL